MIAAYVAGYEVWAELIARDQDQHHRKGWHPSAVFGPVAAAAAAAVLRRLDAGRASHAVGIAASLAGGVVANFGSMTKSFHLGRAAQSGLIAARLAERGMTSSPDAIEHDAGLLQAVSPRGEVDRTRAARLGQHWAILEIGLNVKLYPVCYGAHRIIDGMLDLRRRHALAAADIASVAVDIGETQATILRNHRPQNALDAKFSAEFAIAAAAVAGDCGLAELTGGVRPPQRRAGRSSRRCRFPPVPTDCRRSRRSPPMTASRSCCATGASLRPRRSPIRAATSSVPSMSTGCGASSRTAPYPTMAEPRARALFEQLQALDRLAAVAELDRPMAQYEKVG